MIGVPAIKDSQVPKPKPSFEAMLTVKSAELNKLLLFIKKEKKTGILLIEHDMSVVMEISDHVVVLNYGKKIFQGSAKETKNSPAVIEAYLGTEE